MSDQTNNPFNIPTERIDLPTKGLLYPKENPLSQGFVEITYPTAKHEDILTNINYIEKNIAEQKFIEALIVTKIDYKTLLQGDKDAIMIAARILAFGKEYSFTRLGERFTVDLTTLAEKPIDESVFVPGKTEFEYTLPIGKAVITFKYLTMGDEEAMELEERGLTKLNPNFSGGSTLYLRQAIVAINGKRDRAEINRLSENMLMQDSKAFKKHVLETRPGMIMTATATNSVGEVLEDFRVPITLSFFWPEY